MTELLEQALAATDRLPPEMQDEVARMILAIVDRQTDVYELSDEESAALDEAERGGFATDEEVAALWTNVAR